MGTFKPLCREYRRLPFWHVLTNTGSYVSIENVVVWLALLVFKFLRFSAMNLIGDTLAIKR